MFALTVVICSFVLYVHLQRIDNYPIDYDSYDDYDTNNSSRIIGGVPANIFDHPYVACYTQMEGSMCFCGTAIVSKYWLLTAAHCIYSGRSMFPNGREVIRSNSNFWREGNIRPVISNIIINNAAFGRDIALLQVGRAFDSQYEIPIPIADGSSTYRGESIATVMGWGRTEFAISNDQLYKVDVEIMSQYKCHKIYQRGENELCTFTLGKSSCYGDSGGPLVQNGILIGIVSTGPINCGYGEPAIYTDVAKFYEWLKKLDEEYQLGVHFQHNS